MPRGLGGTEWARKVAYSTALHAAIFYEQGQGIPASETERRWDGGRTVEVRSMRRLEEVGFRNLEDLTSIATDDMVRLGIRRDLAEQIRAYVSGTEHRTLGP